MPRDLTGLERKIYEDHLVEPYFWGDKMDRTQYEYWFKCADNIADRGMYVLADVYWNIAIWCEQNAMDAERLATNA